MSHYPSLIHKFNQTETLVTRMDGNAGRLGLTRIRLAHRGLARLAPYNLCGLQSLARPAHHLARCPQAGPLFYFLKIFMIKLSMFKNW